jgi:hypothetical protein
MYRVLGLAKRTRKLIPQNPAWLEVVTGAELLDAHRPSRVRRAGL